MTTAWRQRGRPPYPDVLTRTEWAILLRVRDGLSNAEIAKLRRCRADTVKYHVANIVAKLELADRDALRRWNGYPLDGEELPGVELQAIEEKARMTTRTAPGVVTGVAPMFLVDDVARTAEWYRDHLGFQIGEYFREDHGAEHSHDGGEPHTHPHPNGLGQPVFVILNRDGHQLMLGKTVEPGKGVISNRDSKRYSGDAYFWVDGVEALFAYAKSTGVAFELELEPQSYGLTEFQVWDPDGRLLTFGGPTPP